jgi:hypothetical protein
MKLLLFVAANAIAFASGANMIGYSWLILVFGLNYIRAIFAESFNLPDRNFRRLSNEDFMKSELNIKLGLFRRILSSLVFFGFGYGAQGWGLI